MPKVQDYSYTKLNSIWLEAILQPDFLLQKMLLGGFLSIYIFAGGVQPVFSLFVTQFIIIIILLVCESFHRLIFISYYCLIQFAKSSFCWDLWWAE